MDWRDELITSTIEAEDFLKRYFPPIGAEKFVVDVQNDYAKIFCIEAETATGRISALSFEIVAPCGGSYCHWYNLNVGDEFLKRNWGNMAVKCGVGIAHESDVDGITLHSVRHDGPSFWSTVAGAVPSREPMQLSRYIGDVLKNCGNEISLPDIEKIETIRMIAQDNPFGGWRALSQTHIRLADGHFFKAKIFKMLCYEESMVIPLNDAGTQEILRKHVGLIPCFRPAHSESEFRDINASLAAGRTVYPQLFFNF